MNHTESKYGIPLKHKAITEPKLKYKVIKDWAASYPDPIRVKAGEPLALNGRKDIWDGYTWLWAKSLAGKEGWVPDCLVSHEAPSTAQEDYTAVELSCQRGQTLTAEKTTHGWVFCRADDGRCGWVPEKNLIQINRS